MMALTIPNSADTPVAQKPPEMSIPERSQAVTAKATPRRATSPIALQARRK